MIFCKNGDRNAVDKAMEGNKNKVDCTTARVMEDLLRLSFCKIYLSGMQWVAKGSIRGGTMWEIGSQWVGCLRDEAKQTKEVPQEM